MKLSIGMMNTAVRARPALKEPRRRQRTLNPDGSRSTNDRRATAQRCRGNFDPAVFNFDDPKIRVKTYFLRQTRFNICVGCRRIAPSKRDEQPIGRLSLVKRGLRGRTV
jgi:hypothetical protein